MTSLFLKTDWLKMKTKYLINNKITFYHQSHNLWKVFTLNTGEISCKLYKHYDAEDIKVQGIYLVNVVKNAYIINSKGFFENL